MLNYHACAALLSLALGAPAVSAGDGSAPDGAYVPAAPPSPSAPAIECPSLLSGLFAPGALARASLSIAYDQATDHIPEWGSGAAGLRRRTEAALGGHFVRTATEYSLSAARQTDTSYARCRCKGFPARARHALASEFTERRADGSPAAPVARLAGVYASTLAILPFVPARYGAVDALQRGSLLMASDIGFNLLREFSPEIRRALLHGRFRPAP